MKPTPKLAFTIILSLAAAGLFSIAGWAQTEPAAPGAAQTTYQPKFRGDPAKSEAESQTLGYMRTVVRAEKIYYKRHNEFAASLATLAGTPMVLMIPRQAAHRAPAALAPSTH